MAVLLAVASAASGAQYLLLAGLSLVVGVLSGLIAAGMFLASAKLGLLSIRARHLTILFEVLLFAPGVALCALGSNAAQDGPFADGGDGLIALTGLCYAAGAVVVDSLLLFAPTIRRRLRR